MTGAAREMGSGNEVKGNVFRRRRGRLLRRRGGGKEKFCLEVHIDCHLTKPVAGDKEEEVHLALYRGDFGHSRGELPCQPCHTVLVVTLTRHTHAEQGSQYRWQVR